MNHECLVPVFPHHLLQKGITGASFLLDETPLAPAGVHQQSDAERKIALLGEILDGLRAPVFGQREIILGEVADNFAFFRPHRRRHVHHLHVR